MYPYASSFEQTAEKLEYDMYYLPAIARCSGEAGGHQKYVPASGSQDLVQDHRVVIFGQGHDDPDGW